MSSTSPKLSRLGKVQFAGETTFGLVGSNFDDVQVAEVDRSGITQASLEHAHQKQAFLESPRILGVKSGSKLVTKHWLAGPKSTLPVAAYAHTTPDAAGATGWDQIWGAIAMAFGVEATGGFTALSLATAPSTADVIKMMDAQTTFGAAGFLVGQAVAWVKADGTYEVSWLEAVSDAADPNTADTLQTCSEAPAGLGLFGSYTAALDTADTYRDGTPASMSIKVYGHDSDDLLTCVGCFPSNIKMSFPLNEVPHMSIEWHVTSWTETGSGGAPSVTTWPVDGAFTRAAPEAISGGKVVWGTTAATTRVIQDLEFDLGLSISVVKDYSSPQNVRNVFRTDCKPRVTFKVLRDVSEEPTEWADGTTRPFVATFGSRPGKMFSICIPRAQIVEFPGFAVGDGAIMAPVTLAPEYYTGDTGSSALADTICRFAFL